jgi:hypothetical protein
LGQSFQGVVPSILQRLGVGCAAWVTRHICSRDDDQRAALG